MILASEFAIVKCDTMSDIGAVELFGRGIPATLTGKRPECLAEAFENHLYLYHSGKAFTEALTDLLREARSTGKTSNPVLGFLQGYEPVFRAYEKILPTEESIKAKAIFNQQLAQGLFLAQNDPETRETAVLFVQTIGAMDKAEVPLGVACDIYLSGARAQAGLMRVFSDQSYMLFLPDVHNPDEVWEWDVRGGVDFAVVDSQKRWVLLVDAKSDSAKGDDRLDFCYHFRNPQEARARVMIEIARSVMQKDGVQGGYKAGIYPIEIKLHNRAMNELGVIAGRLSRQLVHSIEKKLGGT